MSQIAEALAKKTIRNFSLADLIKHKTNPYKNLYEICHIYPNKGKEFKFWRKTWPENSYWVLKDVNTKDPGHGKAYGILYWQGTQQTEFPVYIKGGNKRGVWKYEINNATAILDNGLTYSSQDLQNYKNILPQFSRKQNKSEAEQ
ncbi:hypothetical protein PPERSA_07727 [Pseudocohnilembus persalinus]|uniref:Uncharacterized protein n=1 Tax=Pseudocohnilembus persalinus TaxID=266149 RepID=A0A0V0R9U4_PSEPJ|nr:hypothetical protein PPERSA_07727 [Pseudocohnilembus persalinus]|eukprot:KRX11202.1 hypothetical protein PPERSA_07727 [Pseudocohnilembus persalinus]